MTDTERERIIFQEIVVEYPSYNTYPEYKGKPYFSIKYTENGQGFIGYGTYKPEVLSEYLKEYFMPSAQPTATWLIHKWGDDAKCSNCGRSFKDVYDMDNYDQYCRHCGTHMKGIRAI